MNILEQTIEKLKDINLYQILDEIFLNNRVQEEVIRLNQDQLQSGIDSKDKEIVTIGGSPYRATTIAIKEYKGQPTDVVTLYDTGEFYNSFRVTIRENGYEIEADFEKEDGNIMDNFLSTYDFMGLTPESLAELTYETILPRLEKILIEKLR